MYYLYILQNESNKKFYIGQTNNLQDRIKRHNEGRSMYTKGKGCWQLYYFEEFKDRTEATRREIDIKKKKSRIYIENLAKIKHFEG